MIKLRQLHFTTLYYQLKPYIPARLRLGLRRVLARNTRRNSRNVWPISPSAAQKPPGWPGWPHGKQFAFVIVHDVEGQAGLNKCRQLMDLEQSLGFCSSFNFIPEGGYTVPRELRQEVVQRGCEVGVHDLHHDGKLYQNRKEFSKNAFRINNYLHEWDAVGFRSAFMLNRLEWLHDLNIAYDASTFDTDPFEPQPQGQNTIFPFWVPRPGSSSQLSTLNPQQNSSSDLRPPTADSSPRSSVGALTSGSGSGLSTLNSQLGSSLAVPGTPAFSLQPSALPRNGYIELPYTLAQDSTLFLVLREQTPDIWFRKLEWIAKHGGMAMIGVHPDYVSFGNAASGQFTYPEERYKQFLLRVRETYAGAYWNGTPRDIANFFAQTLPEPSEAPRVPHVQTA